MRKPSLISSFGINTFRIFISMLIILISVSDAYSSFSLERFFYKRFNGKVGDSIQVQIELTRVDSLLFGNICYPDLKIEYPFTVGSLVDSDGNVYLEEDAGDDEEYNQVITGIFVGKFVSNEEIVGTWKNPISDKTMNFKIQESYPEDAARFNLLNYYKSYGICDESPCCAISFTFPFLKDSKNPEVERIINSRINSSLLEGYTFYADLKNPKKLVLEDLISHYIKTYADGNKKKKNKKPTPPEEGTMQVWVSDYSIFINTNEHNLLSLIHNSYDFTGGAQGNYFVEYINFDMKNGREIELQDIFIENYQQILFSVAEKIFRQNFNLGPNDDLGEAGFYFTNGIFSLNDNFLLQRRGIYFTFNTYEVAAYAMGTISVFVPYSEIKEIISQSSILSEFIK